MALNYLRIFRTTLVDTRENVLALSRPVQWADTDHARNTPLPDHRRDIDWELAFDRPLEEINRLIARVEQKTKVNLMLRSVSTSLQIAAWVLIEEGSS